MPDLYGTDAQWDVIDAEVAGYLIEEHLIAFDNDVAMRMRLPPSRSMIEMAMPMTLEETMAKAAINRSDSIPAVKFIDRWSAGTGSALTDDERLL